MSKPKIDKGSFHQEVVKHALMSAFGSVAFTLCATHLQINGDDFLEKTCKFKDTVLTQVTEENATRFMHEGEFEVIEGFKPDWLGKDEWKLYLNVFKETFHMYVLSMQAISSAVEQKGFL